MLKLSDADDFVDVQSTRADATTTVTTTGPATTILVSSAPTGNGSLAGTRRPPDRQWRRGHQ